MLVRHSTPFVKEAPLTPDEWMAGIRCLIETGQMCTDWGQEFILLFDVLGLSVLVHAINRKRPGHATENIVLGPFYVPDAPRYPKGASICMDRKREPLLVHGRVVDKEGPPLAGATIDVRASKDDRFYYVQQHGTARLQPSRGLHLEGRWALLVSQRHAAPLPDPRRWSRRPRADPARPPSQPRRTSTSSCRSLVRGCRDAYLFRPIAPTSLRTRCSGLNAL